MQAVPDTLSPASAEPTTARLDALRALVPEAFADGRLDPDHLAAVLGEAAVETGPERYGLTWAGKRAAVRAVSATTTAALAPDREASVHFDATRHAIIEADNLEALRLFQKAYHGRVKMIYIDPPYNTGQDFVYADDFRDGLHEYLRFSGQLQDDGTLSSTRAEGGGRKHSRWLSMMYPRLALARQLLRDDGLICVSIGEEEVHNLRHLLDEVFGEEHYRNTLLARRYDKNLNTQFAEQGLRTLNVGAEYVVVYARSEACAFNPVYRPASEARQQAGYWKGFWNAADRPTMRYPVLGVTPASGQWKWKEEKAREAVANYEAFLDSGAQHLEDYWERTGRQLKFIRRNPGGRGMNQGVEHWVPPSTGVLRTSNWTDVLASAPLTSLGLAFDSPKNPELLKELLRMSTDRGDLVLDFFAGSGTTAHAVLELNAEDGGHRRFLLVQLPEPTGRDDYPTISAITRARVGRIIARMEAADAETLPLDGTDAPDRGFRAFGLTDSAFRAWHAATAPADADTLAAQLDAFAAPLKPGRDPEAVLFELVVKAGLPLDVTLVPSESDGVAYWHVLPPADFPVQDALAVCLAARVTLGALVGMAEGREDLAAPTRVVCLDAAFGGEDALKANAALQLRAAGVALLTA